MIIKCLLILQKFEQSRETSSKTTLYNCIGLTQYVEIIPIMWFYHQKTKNYILYTRIIHIKPGTPLRPSIFKKLISSWIYILGYWQVWTVLYPQHLHVVIIYGTLKLKKIHLEFKLYHPWLYLHPTPEKKPAKIIEY